MVEKQISGLGEEIQDEWLYLQTQGVTRDVWQQHLGKKNVNIYVRSNRGISISVCTQ